MKKILISVAILVFTTTAFSQRCSVVVGSGTSFSNDGPGTYKLTVEYTTTGQKSLKTEIFRIGNPVAIRTECFSDQGPGIVLYSGLECAGGISSFYAIFTTMTGSCNGTQCDIIRFPELGPMPVKLSSFSAVRSKQVVSLNWNTEFEIDSKEFIVERAEGTEFRSVGSIKSNVNSSVRKSYSFNDKNENAGSTYYRLKNVDLNGSFTYSEIRTVKGIGAVNDVTIFPNPTRSNSNGSVVGVTANCSIQLLDFSGKILKNINSNTINSLDLTGINYGTYLIRIIDKATKEIVNKTLTVSN